MASLGHIAVGMAAARVHRGDAQRRWPGMAWWSALSLLPDADVIGFPLGVQYGDPIGLYFVSPYGFFVAATELVLFAPLFLYALRPKRIRVARRARRCSARSVCRATCACATAAA
jgi:hypothetical protein